MKFFISRAWDRLNNSPPSAAYMRWWTGLAVVPVMSCRLFGSKALPELKVACCQMDPSEKSTWNSNLNTKLSVAKMPFKYCLRSKWRPFCPAEMSKNHCTQRQNYTVCMSTKPEMINAEPVMLNITLRPRQDGLHFPGDIFHCIFLNENV